MQPKDTTMDTDKVPSITLLGREHTLSLPPSMFAREALVQAYFLDGQEGIRLFIVVSAAIGLSTRLGRKGYADLDLAKCRFDVLVYGERMYEFLRSRGATQEEIVAVSLEVFKPLLANLFPTEGEVVTALGK